MTSHMHESSSHAARVQARGALRPQSLTAKDASNESNMDERAAWPAFLRNWVGDMATEAAKPTEAMSVALAVALSIASFCGVGIATDGHRQNLCQTWRLASTSVFKISTKPHRPYRRGSTLCILKLHARGRRGEAAPLLLPRRLLCFIDTPYT